MSTQNIYNSGSGTQSKKVRNVSKAHYSKLESSYNQASKEYNDRLAELKKLKAVLLSEKNKTEGKLNRFQLASKRKDFLEKKAELLKYKEKCSLIGSQYLYASRKSSAANKIQMQGKRDRKFLANEAMQNIESIMKDIRQLFSQFGDTNSARHESLKSLATRNGRMFHLNFMKILREVLQNSSPEIKTWVLSTPKVQGELSRMLRVSFGYTKK